MGPTDISTQNIKCPDLKTHNKCKEQVFPCKIPQNFLQYHSRNSTCNSCEIYQQKARLFLEVASKNVARGWGRCRTTMASFWFRCTKLESNNHPDHAAITHHTVRQLIVNFCLLSSHGMLKAQAKTGGYRPVACESKKVIFIFTPDDHRSTLSQKLAKVVKNWPYFKLNPTVRIGQINCCRWNSPCFNYKPNKSDTWVITHLNQGRT